MNAKCLAQCLAHSDDQQLPLIWLLPIQLDHHHMPPGDVPEGTDVLSGTMYLQLLAPGHTPPFYLT